MSLKNLIWQDILVHMKHLAQENTLVSEFWTGFGRPVTPQKEVLIHHFTEHGSCWLLERRTQ